MECLICKKEFKSLLGHLRKHNINAEEYRKRFKLNRKTNLGYTGFYDPRSEYSDVIKQEASAITTRRLSAWGFSNAPPLDIDAVIADEKRSRYLAKLRKESAK